MKEIINYYYKLSIDKIYKKEHNYFYYDNYKYYFIKIGDLKKIKSLVDIENELLKRNIYINEIIKTKEDKYSVLYKKKDYVLIRCSEMESLEIDINTISKYNVTLDNSIIKNIEVDELSILKNEIDSYENKIIGFSEEYKIIQNVFSYYIGICENVVTYLDISIKETTNHNKCLTHKDINKCLMMELIDINNLEYNYRLKDISGYIRSLMINGKEWYEVLDDYLKNNSLNEFEYRYLFCKIIYPKYFFNIIDEVLNNDIEENKIKELIKNVNIIEKEYKYLYELICKYYSIPSITWIK